MATPTSGTKLDDLHTLVRVLDEGGMSTVWLAEHASLGKQVAVKVLRAEQVERDPSLVSRFIAGAEAAARVTDPHLVSLVAHGTTDDGAPWLSMERLDGMSLRARLELGGDSGPPRARVPLSYALAVLEQAAKALHAAHAAGLAHLALSPEKLFVTDAGGAPFVRLLGLGLGKLVDPTRPGGTSTALPYLAPDQLIGAAADHRADVWALAVVAYELMTGRLPYSGANASALYVATATTTPAAPSGYDPGLGAAVDALFARAFSRDPAARFASAEELSRTLVAALTGGAAATAVAPMPPLPGASPKPSAPSSGPPIVATPEFVPPPEAVAPSTERHQGSAVGRVSLGVVAALVVVPTILYLASRPGSRTLVVNAERDGKPVDTAQVYVDGQQVCTFVPCRVKDVAPGWREVRVESGTLARSESFEMRSNRSETEVTVRLVATAAATSSSAAKAAASCPSGMALIPGGPFQMGSDTGEADEKPAHEVKVESFCLDITEVTAAAYASCVEAGKCTSAATDVFHVVAGRTNAHKLECNFGVAARAQHPINCVDWTQADAYCKAQGRRLPTEAEWEYAAKGGDEGRLYPWGATAPAPALLNACGPECVAWAARDGLPAKALYPKRDSHETTAPVGSYQGTGRWGVLDLGGNVVEWTSSVYSASHAVAPDDTSRAVIRGGGWGSQTFSHFRSSFRIGFDASETHDTIGFRCAGSPSSPSEPSGGKPAASPPAGAPERPVADDPYG